MASDHDDDLPPGARDRDLVDQRLAQAARAARVPHGLPAPRAGEPSDDLLLRVLAGVATAEEQKVVGAGSAYTRERLELLREALAETGHAAAPGLVERAARYVFVMAKDALELLRAATEPLVLPGAAPVRSGASGAEARIAYYEFVQPIGDLEAHLKIEHVARAAAPAHVDLQVTVTRPGGGGAGTRVSLVRAGTVIDSVPVAAGSAATFEGLVGDRYEIVFRKAGQDEPLGRLHLDLLAS
jgi:hypothetical protein